jgi:tRNA threonylcarbamoyladenosine biosynthesis protein TsaE
LQSWKTTTSGPEDTRDLGRCFGELATAGLIVLLNGDLGAGKTCFAQGVAKGLEVSTDAPVTSPTYTLLNVHKGRIPLYHFDLYRLSQVEDLAELGYDEFSEGEGITLVEWADRMTDALSASVTVLIENLDEDLRRFSFEALDKGGRELLEQLSERCPAQGIPA